jgi:ATP-binding cassette subfamily C protein CydC
VVAGLSTALTSLLISAAAVLVLVIAIPLVRSGDLDGVTLAVLVLAAVSGFEAVLPLPAAYQHLGSTLEAGRRLFEIVENPSFKVKESPQRTQRAQRLAREGSRGLGVSIQNLCFRYEAGEPLVLDRVSFHVRPGGTLAVVGPSGAGKSTLAHLLLRFWDYESGEIRLGGRDLRDYGPEESRALMSVVSQTTYLFNATIRDNLRIAKPDAHDDDLIRAVQGAQLHDFMAALPQGFETWIGEQGLRLSGGERQRLAIARAILKDAPILILDEATANLDAVTERAVLQIIGATSAGQTTLMITHRLVGLEAADEILVLHAGRVVERGRHDQLIQMNGLYRRMWDQQNQIFAADS